MFSMSSAGDLLFVGFPTCKHILEQWQQMTFQNIVAKGEIAHDEQFLLWPHTMMEIFQDFVTMFSMSSSADLSYVGKG